MRLIDADAFVKRFNNLCETDTDKQIACIVMGAIASEPTAYDIDKVVEELKNLGGRYCENVYCSYECENCEHGILMKKAIEIVEQGLKEQNN